jgi:hypothetical protein
MERSPNVLVMMDELKTFSADLLNNHAKKW